MRLADHERASTRVTGQATEARNLTWRSEARLSRSSVLTEFFPIGARQGLSVTIAAALGCSAVGPNSAKGSATERRPPAAVQPANDVTTAQDAPVETLSPRPHEGESGYALDLVRRCGAGDQALMRAARELGDALRRRAPALDPPGIVDSIRKAGAPYVWPRAWTRSARVQEREETLEKMSGWLNSFGDGGERRCGVAIEATRAGEELAIVVAVDVLADLRPLPIRARLGSWMEVEADMLVPTSGAKVVVLGPRGRPKPVPTSASASLVRARFSADQPGLWLVQVLADVAGGPRPVLEARVFADSDPADIEATSRAPGEEHALGVAPVFALESMIIAARRGEDLPPLARDGALDRIATAHAEHMRAERRLAHDVGDGNPAERIGQAGLPVAAAGENVAHAANAIRAQRALWSSPSHRANLLNSHFDIVGIGVAEDEDGSVWVCELFADLEQ